MSFLAVIAVCFLVLSASPAGAYYKAHGGHGDDRLVSRVGGAALNGRAGNDRLVGLSGKEILYGGPGDDVLSGAGDAWRSSDDLFGGGPCSETGHYGFDDHPLTKPCNRDGADVRGAGRGDDRLRESNSDLTGDGQVDVLIGGRGYDVCTVEEIDIVRNCEDVRIVPTRSST